MQDKEVVESYQKLLLDHQQLIVDYKTFLELLPRYHDLFNKYDGLIQHYNKYVRLLGEELNEVVPFAYNHGWRSTRYEERKMFREIIEKINKEIEEEDLYYK